MHGASGRAPKGNRNALKHGEFTAESLGFKKEIAALARMGPQDNVRDRIARCKIGPRCHRPLA